MRRTLFFVCAAALVASGFALARGVQPSSTSARSVPPPIVQQLLRQAPMHPFANGSLAVTGGVRSVPPRVARQLLRGTAPLHAFTNRPLAGVRASANSQQFADPTGDSGAGPDISFVNVSNDDSGNLTIQVTLANRTSLGAQDGTLVLLDTDRNQATGTSGFDYALVTLGNSWTLLAWNGSAFAVAPAPTFSASFGPAPTPPGGVITYKGNRSDLANTNGFFLAVATTGDNGTTTSDSAPDVGLWEYLVTIGSATSQQFVDPSGDSGSGPDVASVSVSSDGSGRLTIQVSLANRPALGSQDGILVPLDTDLNPGTGSGGFDYVLVTIGGTWTLAAWNGSAFAPAPAPTFSASFAAGVLTFTGNRSDLGNTNGFNFGVVTTPDGGTTTSDVAPDSGVWTYQIGAETTGSTTTSTTTTTTTPPPPPPLTLGVAKLIVGTPKAGGKWLVTMIVFRNDTGDLLSSGKVICSARAGARPLQFLGKVGPASGLVACQWKVPKTQKGKRATGSMKVLFQGKSVSRSFSKKIR